MTPDMKAAQGVLGIVTYLHQPVIDNSIAKKLIFDTVNEVGPFETIVGLANLVRILMYLRADEVGVESNLTLTKIGMILAELETK